MHVSRIVVVDYKGSDWLLNELVVIPGGEVCESGAISGHIGFLNVCCSLPEGGSVKCFKHLLK